jgi:hypothetical protein
MASGAEGRKKKTQRLSQHAWLARWPHLLVLLKIVEELSLAKVGLHNGT